LRHLVQHPPVGGPIKRRWKLQPCNQLVVFHLSARWAA
jgi:hypothetical protein